MLDIKFALYERHDHGAASDIGLPSKQPSAKDYLNRVLWILGWLWRIPKESWETLRLLIQFPRAWSGEPDGQCSLGVMYAKGEGVAQDYAEAVKWFRRAAEQGLAAAQNNLGASYDKGEGVAQDYAEAVKWYRRAAEQGLAAAQNNLGGMYDKGDGVVQDYAEAGKWYRLAAEQGLAEAQLNLGLMYYKGEGVGQDLCGGGEMVSPRCRAGSCGRPEQSGCELCQWRGRRPKTILKRISGSISPPLAAARRLAWLRRGMQ